MPDQMKCAVCVLVLGRRGSTADTMIGGTATCGDHATIVMMNPLEVAVRIARQDLDRDR